MSLKCNIGCNLSYLKNELNKLLGLPITIKQVEERMKYITNAKQSRISTKDGIIRIAIEFDDSVIVIKS